jgi:hypothetical protein
MSDTPVTLPAATPAKCPIPPKGRKWIARLGVAGFVFFLVKGILWLTVPAALVWLGVR